MKTNVSAAHLVAQPASLSDLSCGQVREYDRVTEMARAYVRLRGLSRRESEVFTRFVLEGKASKVIAGDLGIADTTVRLYWTRICRKLGCGTAIEAMLAFVRESATRCLRCELSGRHHTE